jgi:hypothetical protein
LLCFAAQLSRHQEVQFFGTMKREDDQELWELLGKSSNPTLSPFFSRNVVRAVRQEQDSNASMWRSFRPRVLIPSAAVAAAIVAAAVMTQQMPSDVQTSPDYIPETVAKVDPQDYDIVADLDVLLAWEEERLWEDV